MTFYQHKHVSSRFTIIAIRVYAKLGPILTTDIMTAYLHRVWKKEATVFTA